MFITDSTGMRIEIFDLDAAIKMAEGFIANKRAEQDPGLQRFEESRQAYWQDVLSKLLQLKDVS